MAALSSNWCTIATPAALRPIATSEPITIAPELTMLLAAIVRAVAGLGISLGVQTTAEGVETPEQLAQVTSEGCTEVQGYLFSPPRPGAETGALIARLNAAAPLGQALAG